MAEEVSEGSGSSGVIRIARLPTLTVTGMDKGVTQTQLLDLFNEVAPVASVDLVTPLSDDLPFAFIKFKHKKDAINARDSLHSTCLNGNPLRITLAEVVEGRIVTNGCANIFVKNLDATIDDEFLRRKFSRYGTILSAKVATDSSGKSRGYGYVQFKEEKDAQTAIMRLDEMKLCKKEICVRPFISKQVRDERKEAKLRRSVFVKNLSGDVNRKLLKDVFERSGRVKFADTHADLYGEPRGTGYVTFEIEDEAAHAEKELNGHIHNGKTWEVKLAWSEKSEPRIKHESREGTNLYVKNIDKCVNDEKLEELFSQFGRITSCKVILDSYGLSKGFGFVAFSTAEEASEAVKEMNGKVIGRMFNPLYVAVAQRKEERKSMLQARFAEASSQKFVAMVQPGSSVLAPPYSREQFQFRNRPGIAPGLVMQYQVGRGGYGIPQLMPPLLHHNTNQGYMLNARLQHIPVNYADVG